ILNNTDTLIQVVTGSFDPNDKLVAEGIHEARYVKFENYLTYTIRFQNTGTDTAFFVNILDTLDINMDLTSLEIIGSSHSMNYFLYDHVLHFEFDNIFLPDSNRNEPASHGFVKFKIKGNAGIADQTVIRNAAAI